MSDRLDYPNVGWLIGSVVSSGLASYAELQSVLSTEDAYNLLEIATVDRYNARPRKQ